MFLPSAVLVASSLLLALSGCAAAEPKSDPNAAACSDFSALYYDRENIETAESGATPAERLAFRDAFKSEMDKIALKSEGDVKSRLTDLVDDLPDDPVDLVVSFSPSMETYRSNADRVMNACEATEAD